jgi:hypothetical protein
MEAKSEIRARTHLEVPGARVDATVIDDPLLGPAHVIRCADGRTTTMSAIDWSRPTTIPTVAAPGVLPPGTGGAIMNAIAERALAAGVPALRYAGRYPTAALFKTLLRSFRTAASEADFTSHFQLLGAPIEIPIDFAPAPFTRIDHASGFVEMRDGVLERAVVHRVSYEIDGSPARLVDAHAQVWFGDACYADVATFDPRGDLIDGPYPIPRSTSSVIDQVFPVPLVAALAELVAEVVPSPIAQDAKRFLTSKIVRWGDLGARAASMTPSGDIFVHAAIWDRIAPLGFPRLALALAEALGPVVTLAVVAEIGRAAAVMSPRA